MNFLSWIAFGLIVGIIANFLSRKPSAENLVGTIMLGVLGSTLGGLLGNLVFQGTNTSLNNISFAIAAVSGLTILSLDRVFNKH